ncbi:MAG: AP2/ERF family transcription factor [Candidatus Thermochlorobacter sp.]
MTKEAKKQQPEKSLKLQSEPGVTRVDHRNTHGWLMRLHHQGTTYTKLFSDGVYGSAKKALKAARKYRKQLGKTLGIESLSKRRRTRSVSSRNTATGVVGVYRLTSKGKNGVVRHYYAASWNPEPNKVKTKSFSIAKYGEAEAFRLAVEYRQSMVAKIMGRQPEVERVQSATRYAPADMVIASKEQKKRKAKSKKKKDAKKAKKPKDKKK